MSFPSELIFENAWGESANNSCVTKRAFQSRTERTSLLEQEGKQYMIQELTA